MIRFLSLSSGSCGNCYWLGGEQKGLLIDAGVSFRSMKKILEANSLSFDSIAAVLVTHDHFDHIRHLGRICNKLSKPVYTTDTLNRALLRYSMIGPWFSGCGRVLGKDEWNEVGPAQVRYFEVPHDATQTVGYAIRMDGHKFVIMTDLGRMTDEALHYASEADTVVIESNYDVDMLMGGSYPYDLKMRIVQGNGHLSNDECAVAIERFVHPGLRNIFLCHLSENNNTPDLAFNAASAALSRAGIEKGTVALRCLPRRTPSPIFYL